MTKADIVAQLQHRSDRISRLIAEFEAYRDEWPGNDEPMLELPRPQGLKWQLTQLRVGQSLSILAKGEEFKKAAQRAHNTIHALHRETEQRFARRTDPLEGRIKIWRSQ